MTTGFPVGGSEYGGLPGPYQGLPHDPADYPHEQLNLVTQTDPSDVEASAETVLAEHLKRAKGRQ